LRIPEERITTIANGVDRDRFRPIDGESPSPYLLYVSRLEHPGKNHLRLLRAFAHSSGARTHRLVLAGPDWGGLSLIQEEIARLGLSSRVDYLGRVSDEALPGLVARASAVAMVGLCEGFGLPALEALSCGRPVVAANAGALPEVVGPLAALCDPLDTSSIAAAIDKVLLDPDLRRRAALEGRAWAARFDWDTAADALLRECRAALQAHRRAVAA
jgi:glycosyltransferase involved in cell wall biosynthesis